MMRTGAPSRAFNDDNIDIDFLRHGPRQLPKPSPPERVGPQGFDLYMEAGQHEFTPNALDLGGHDHFAGGRR
jgi:hypothetical protein